MARAQAQHVGQAQCTAEPSSNSPHSLYPPIQTSDFKHPHPLEQPGAGFTQWWLEPHASLTTQIVSLGHTKQLSTSEHSWCGAEVAELLSSSDEQRRAVGARFVADERLTSPAILGALAAMLDGAPHSSDVQAALHAASNLREGARGLAPALLALGKKARNCQRRAPE